MGKKNNPFIFDTIWDLKARKNIKPPDNMTAFLNDINEVCKKHGMSISHEDGHGSFIITKYDEENIKWLFGASKGF